MNPTMRTVILGGMTLVLLIVVIFSSNVRTVNAVKGERVKAVAAVAASIKEEVIRADRLKLQQILNQVAERGGMQTITITDTEGRTLASTDRQKDAGPIAELNPPPKDPVVTTSKGVTVIREAVWLAQDNAIGGIEVVYGPR